MKEVLGFVGRMGLVLLVGIIPFAVRLFLPLRHHDGTWRVTHAPPAPWTYEWEDARKGAQVRDYIWGVDWFQRREYDWEGDGVYDCHEDECVHKGGAGIASCVFYRQGWRWIAAPPEVTRCLPGQGPLASR